MILKCFYTRDREILKLAFCTYVRPLLEFACQVFSPTYRYLIDKTESVQRFFTEKLHGLRHISYQERLKRLNISPLELRRLHFDTVVLILDLIFYRAHCKSVEHITAGHCKFNLLSSFKHSIKLVNFLLFLNVFNHNLFFFPFMGIHECCYPAWFVQFKCFMFY